MTQLTLTTVTPGSLGITNPSRGDTFFYNGSGWFPTKEHFNVLAYGAVGDGSADDTTAIQTAVNAASAASASGIVFLPRGRYKITSTITVPSWVTLRGIGGAYRSSEWGLDASTARTRIEIGGSKNFTMVTNSDHTNGNTSITIDGIVFDQGGCVSDTPIIDFNKVRRSIVRDCYLFGGNPTTSTSFWHQGASENNILERCFFEGGSLKSFGSSNQLLINTCEFAAAGIWLLGGIGHVIQETQVYQNALDATYDSWFPYKTGINLDHTTDVKVIGCSSAYCRNSGIGVYGCLRSIITGNHFTGNGRQIPGLLAGIDVNTSGAGACDGNIISKNVSYDYGGLNQQGYGIYVRDTAGVGTTNNIITENDFRNNYNQGMACDATGLATNIFRDNLGGVVTNSVASAATITLPPGADPAFVTGTTTITSITAGYINQRVTLVFIAALTLTNGSNLKLNGNFVTATWSTITLSCDGTTWYEVARKP